MTVFSASSTAGAFVTAAERARVAFAKAHGSEPTVIVQAPGRVNLIGEHTDYNDGFVLPMALPFATAIALTPNDTCRIEVSSEGFADACFSIEDPLAAEGWSRYVHGTAQLVAADGYPATGWTGCIATDIPTGASLSSSAALEVATGLATVTAARGSISSIELAKIAQRVENDLLGLPSGIMDQLASAACTAGCAVRIDCRDLSLTDVVLPSDATVIILDTGTRRKLLESEYAARQDACHTAATTIGVASLRDARLNDLDTITDDRVRRRARHVVTANRRVSDAVHAMQSGDTARLGELMSESHRSLRDDFEVTGPALDAIVTLAESIDGCHGARMTGGGFAGCAVALVDNDAVDHFCQSVLDHFNAPDTQPATEPTQVWPVTPSAGAHIVTDQTSRQDSVHRD